MRFLLSTGLSTDKIEYYVLDLFKLHLNILPGDIPTASSLGFNFNMVNVFKDNLESELKNRISTLILNIQKRFDPNSVKIAIKSLNLINETQALLVVSVNGVESDEITLNLYE